MTPIIARDYTLRLDGGETIRLIVPIRRKDGSYVDPTGRDWRMRFLDGRDQMIDEEIVGEVIECRVPDQDAPVLASAFLLPGLLTEDLSGRSYVRYQTYPLVEGGRSPGGLKGKAIIARGGPFVQGSGQVRDVMARVDEASPTVIVDNFGPPGLTPWEAEKQTYAAWKAANVTDPVDAALSDLNQLAAGKIAEVDDAIGAAGVAEGYTRAQGDYAKAQGDEAKGVVDAGATILAAVPAAQAARTGSETARAQSEAAALRSAVSATSAQALSDQVEDKANLAGVYVTRADLTAGLATQVDGVVLVAADETMGGAQALYTVKAKIATFRALWRDGERLLRPFAFGQKVLTEARERPIRIMMDGTSISTFSGSPNQLLVQRLKEVYGDAQFQHIFLASLGGSYETAFSGWKKQPFGGIAYHRLRGDSTSATFTQTFYGSRFELLYSTETDGGSFVLRIDGVDYPVDCAGPQAYGKTLVIDLPLGVHKVTFVPPASGYAYPEHLFVSRGLRGIEVIDGTFGGSALQQHRTGRLAGGAQVAGIPVVGDNGVDAVFNRPDVDFIIYSGSVNDAGNLTPATYDAAFNRLIATTHARNVPLLIQAEMAGHYAVPADPNGGYANFAGIKGRFFAAQRAYRHVHVCDWDALTRLDDLDLYASRYYTLTSGTGSSAGYVGDYIHPTIAGQRVGQAAMCACMGVAAPGRDTWQELRAAQASAGFGASTTPVTLRDCGIEKTLPVAGFAHRLYGGGGTFSAPVMAPMVNGRTIKQLSRYSTNLTTGTSDADGAYREWSNAAVSLLSGLGARKGDRLTLTAKVKGSGSIRLDGRIFFGGTLVWDTAVDGAYTVSFATGDLAQWITCELELGSVDFYVLSGRFYEINLTRTGGVPVTGCGDYLAPTPRILPCALLAGDPDYATLREGQEYANAFTRGVLVGPARRFDHALYNAAIAAGATALEAEAAAMRDVGLYRCTDRTGAAFQQVGFSSGTITTSTDLFTGGISEDSTADPLRWGVTVDLTGEPVMSLAIPVVGRLGWSARASFFNGSNNASMYLKPDGSFQAAQATAYPGRGTFHYGEVIALRLNTAGMIAAIGRTNPTLYVQVVGGSDVPGGYLRPTLVRGEQAMI